MPYYNVTMLQYYCLCYNFMSYHVILLFCVKQFCLCLVMKFSNVMLYITMLFFVCLVKPFLMRYCYFIRYNVVLCLVMLFCNDATLFCTLQYCIVSYQIVLQSHNIVLFLIMLFCIITILYVFPNIAL